jgi:hypothetical protein
MAVLLGLPCAQPLDAVDVTATLRLGQSAERTDQVVVIDAGTALHTAQQWPGAEVYLVLRGPCYMALHGLLRAGDVDADGVIVMTEAGRSLGARDVSDTLGLIVAAEIPCNATVARTLDAGLLVSRARRLPELRPLRRLTRPPAPNRVRPRPPRPVPAPAPPPPDATPTQSTTPPTRSTPPAHP